MYIIKLDDGTEFEAELSMTTWKSDTEPDDSVFANNTSNVSYTTPDGDEVVLGECHYFRGIQDTDGKYMFFLNPITEDEKRAAEQVQQRADIDYIAMETGIEL